MSASSEVQFPWLICFECKCKRKLDVQLKPCKIDEKLMMFICAVDKCFYPLNSSVLPNYVFQQGPHEGEFVTCGASEVTNLNGIFQVLMEKKQHAVSNALKMMVIKELIGPVSSYNSVQQHSVFPMWKNKDALHWLHSILCIFAHSRKLKQYFKYEDIENCKLKEIFIAYDKAMLAVNSQNMHNCVSYLEKLREQIVMYMQPRIKLERGQEEPRVSVISHLLKENKSLHNAFLSKFALNVQCGNCGYTEVLYKTEPLISVNGTILSFNNCIFTYVAPCVMCKRSGQKITLEFLHLPPLLLMHFTSGLPSSNMGYFNFLHDGQQYCVKGFVQYCESSQKFMSWIKSDEKWMCCDDLPLPLQNSTAPLPAVPVSEIHAMMWERKETSDENVVKSSCTDSRETYVSEELHISEESSAHASQKFNECTDIGFNKNSSTPCPEVLSPSYIQSKYRIEKVIVSFGSLYDASERNIREEPLACVKSVSATSKRKGPSLQRKLSTKKVCTSVDESHILGKEESMESNRMSDGVAGFIENQPIQETEKGTSNAQSQNTSEVLQPSKNLRSKSIHEDYSKAVAEISAGKKSESTISHVTSGSRNEAEGKNLSSHVDFKLAVLTVEGCTDSETNTNSKLSSENVDDSLFPAVEDTSRNNHETSKMNKTKVASHFQTMQHSEHSYAASFPGSVPECYVVVDQSEVDMYTEKRGCWKTDSNKEDRCSQSAISSPKTAKAQSHDGSRKVAFPVENNDMETASSGEPSDISIGMVMSPLAHNMPFKKTQRRLKNSAVRRRKNSASTRSPSTEQTEPSVASSPVSSRDSGIEELKTGTGTGNMSRRMIKSHESEHKSAGQNTVHTDINTPVTSDAFTSSITTMDQSVAYSMKENASVHPEAALNDNRHTELGSLPADFEMKKNSRCEVISPCSSSSLFPAPSANDSASSGDRANTSDAEDLKTQQPNNLDIPSVKDARTELKSYYLRQTCRRAVSSVLEGKKGSTRQRASGRQKTPKSGKHSNTAVVEDLGNILALKDPHQVSDQNRDVPLNDTTSNEEDSNSHTATDEGRSSGSSEPSSPKHSTLNKKKPCAKVIGQRKTYENVTRRKQVTTNEISKSKKISKKNEPDKILELDNDFLQESCFQSKSMNYNKVADSVCKQKVEQKSEPDSVKFKKVLVGTQPSVPECHVEGGFASVNSDSNCTDLKSNEIHLRVAETKSPKPSSSDTDLMKSVITRAKSKSPVLKTSKASPNAKGNILIFENIVAEFHCITENDVAEDADKVSGVPSPVEKSKCAKKKHEKENSFTQVSLSTSSVDSNKLNASSKEVTAAARPKKKYAKDKAFYVAVKAMILERNAYLEDLNQSQKAGSAPEKELGVVDDCAESVSVRGSASQDLTIEQKFHGWKIKCSKDEVQDGDKSSLPENSSEPGTAEGIVSQKKKMLRMKNIRFKIGESKESHFLNEGIKTACSSSEDISQSDILVDQSFATKGETQSKELRSSISSRDSKLRQTKDDQPEEGKFAAAKGKTSKPKKSFDSIPGPQKKKTVYYSHKKESKEDK